MKVTSNQLWNANYSAHQTYLHSRIVSLKEKGLGYRKIAQQLNSEGIKTPPGATHLYKLGFANECKNEALRAEGLIGLKGF